MENDILLAIKHINEVSKKKLHLRNENNLLRETTLKYR